MNGQTHEQYGKAAARLILTCGLAPSVEPYLREGRPDFLAACSMPDRATEVTLVGPGVADVTDVLGHNLNSFRHFQCVDRGYRWLGDDSLSIAAEVVAAAAAVAGLRMVAYDGGLKPPLSGLLRDSPLVGSLRHQPGATIGSFRFPSAGEEAGYWLTAARRWAADGNMTGWRRCAGYACHHVQDACAPHHSWGVLLYGHSAWEDALEVEWHRALAGIISTETVGSELAPAVRKEMEEITENRVSELCVANALWARRVFGEPRDLHDCAGDAALRVSVRAVAATVRALELMLP